MQKTSIKHCKATLAFKLIEMHIINYFVIVKITSHQLKEQDEKEEEEDKEHSGLAPQLRRNCEIESWPMDVAKYRGVAPLLLLEFTLAPLSTKDFTVSRQPLSTAKCSGVCPSQSWRSMSMPCSVSITTTSLCPFIAAVCRAVRPY